MSYQAYITKAKIPERPDTNIDSIEALAVGASVGTSTPGTMNSDGGQDSTELDVKSIVQYCPLTCKSKEKIINEERSHKNDIAKFQRMTTTHDTVSVGNIHDAAISSGGI
jgi:hypothetical protein